MDVKTTFKTCYKQMTYYSQAKMLLRGPMKSAADVHNCPYIDNLIVSRTNKPCSDGRYWYLIGEDVELMGRTCRVVWSWVDARYEWYLANCY